MRAPYCDDPVHVFSDDHCPASKDPSKPTPEETAALFAWSDRNKDRFIRSPEEEAEIERNSEPSKSLLFENNQSK